MLHVLSLGTQKFDGNLGHILRDELRWLSVPDPVFYKLTVTIHRYLNDRAPPYLMDYCIPVSSADTWWHLRSANRHLLTVPHFWLNTFGRRASSVAGCMVCNSLPDFIRDPVISTDCFRRVLKTLVGPCLLWPNG